MAQENTILRLSGVRSAELSGVRSTGMLSLALAPGELALIDARDPMLAAAFADLCCGLRNPNEGEVRFLERDWSRQPLEVADALRGLIGRVMSAPGWLRFLDAGSNIMLQQLHHTRVDPVLLRDEAAHLAEHFGLPGLPSGSIAELTPGDLLRAGFVRAFLGQPKLVILESPVQGLHRDIVPALINKLLGVCEHGGAGIWLTRSRLIWDDPTFPAAHRLRLDPHGLAETRVAA